MIFVGNKEKNIGVFPAAQLINNNRLIRNDNLWLEVDEDFQRLQQIRLMISFFCARYFFNEVPHQMNNVFWTQKHLLVVPIDFLNQEMSWNIPFILKMVDKFRHVFLHDALSLGLLIRKFCQESIHFRDNFFSVREFFMNILKCVNRLIIFDDLETSFIGAKVSQKDLILLITGLIRLEQENLVNSSTKLHLGHTIVLLLLLLPFSTLLIDIHKVLLRSMRGGISSFLF